MHRIFAAMCPSVSQPPKGTIARKLTDSGTAFIRYDGRRIPLVRERTGTWRLRSRGKKFSIDCGLGTSDLAEARRIAREKLESGLAAKERTKGTLEDIAQLYTAAPKKASTRVARKNVGRLRALVELALGKTLDAVRVTDLSALWPAYVAKRQGRKDGPDYNTRRAINRGINAAMRQAASIFLRRLRPYYQTHGVTLPADAVNITWLPVPAASMCEADDAGLLKAWAALADTDRDLWTVIGLARFAGLRQREILHCRGKWIAKRGEAVYVALQDREGDEFFTKTGRRYSALILHPALAEYLLTVSAEASVIARPAPDKWLSSAPQEWLRKFTGSSRAPLHRLRGLYADQLKRETEIAMAARLAGIKKASENLGHTTTATTTAHYLTPDP
jgi:hypothetical protein